jgi:mannose-6-phosphate isomerase-like protein (cupin superfamily)
MTFIINSPSIITAQGNKPKKIEEYFGRVNSKTQSVSIAKMKSPAGWVEPGQCPEFDEYTVVLKGVLRVKTKKEIIDIKEGQGVLISKNEWVQYSSPFEEGAEYIAVCLPAFSPDFVNRDGMMNDGVME